MARGRGGKSRKKTSRSARKPVPRSPNIVEEKVIRVEGKPAVVRIYRKGWKYSNQYVATVHVGVTKMHNKRPRLGKKVKKKRRR